MGLVGELIYSVAGLVGLTGDGAWQPLTFLLLSVHILRLFQVSPLVEPQNKFEMLSFYRSRTKNTRLTFVRCLPIEGQSGYGDCTAVYECVIIGSNTIVGAFENL